MANKNVLSMYPKLMVSCPKCGGINYFVEARYLEFLKDEAEMEIVGLRCASTDCNYIIEMNNDQEVNFELELE